MSNLILYERRGVFVDQAGPSGPGPSPLWARIEPSFRSWAGLGPKIWVHLTNGPYLNSVVECLKAGPCLFVKNGTWILSVLYMYAHPSQLISVVRFSSRSNALYGDYLLYWWILNKLLWLTGVLCCSSEDKHKEGKKVMALWFESNDMTFDYSSTILPLSLSLSLSIYLYIYMWVEIATPF